MPVEDLPLGTGIRLPIFATSFRLATDMMWLAISTLAWLIAFYLFTELVNQRRYYFNLLKRSVP